MRIMKYTESYLDKIKALKNELDTASATCIPGVCINEEKLVIEFKSRLAAKSKRKQIAGVPVVLFDGCELLLYTHIGKKL